VPAPPPCHPALQELLDKSPLLPADIRWHFIGHLQSNKAKPLLEAVPGLACVQTVDSSKVRRCTGHQQCLACELVPPTG
jgi:uncharacterized pyridoxal phosphate-containing UPF0001 family protein